MLSVYVLSLLCRICHLKLFSIELKYVEDPETFLAPIVAPALPDVLEVNASSLCKEDLTRVFPNAMHAVNSHLTGLCVTYILEKDEMINEVIVCILRLQTKQ